ncbi:DUF3187 family protein [Hydrocarboniphaga sp.]|uniref:DUF3187 family protein n=1 Tax=Hydrocarboniphaga sp. TaxID=2033016 RepID=UPI003D0A7483
MIKLLSRSAVLMAGVAAGTCAVAGERPLAVYNQGALARAFELPVLGETQVLGLADSITDLRYDLTTEYHASGDAGESVILDGESNLLTFAFRRGIGRDLELTFDLPLLYQGGGFMDKPVENWHSAFGLPNGGREDAPRDRYLYEYQRDGQVLLDEHRSGADLGDLRIGFGWQALDGLALRSEVKFPTGSESHLSGGNSGVAVYGDYALPFPDDSIFSGFLSAGGSYNGKTKYLGDMQNRFVPFGSAGLAVRLIDSLSLLAQLYGSGALYDGDLDPFREALQFSLGLRYHVGPAFDLDFGFQEDPITSSSPDFSIHLGLSWRGRS